MSKQASTGTCGRVVLRWRVAVLVAALVCVVMQSGASAQVQVPWIRGAFGLKAASSLPPGVVLGSSLSWYWADQVKDRNGDAFARGDLDIVVPFLTFAYTAQRRLLSAYWSAMVGIALANTSLELPAVNVETGLGPGDLYVRPLNFGWHWPRADITLAYGLYIPTGRYIPNGAQNTGLGIWSNEYDAGATVYFDQKRHWNLSTTGAYQSGSSKSATQVRPGSTLTLQGGAGRAFKAGLGNAGVAYYAQWKVSDDQFAIIPEGLLARHRMFGIGPEVDYPIRGLPRPVIVTGRYFFEMGSRVATQGGTFFLSFTYIQPSPRPRESATNNGR